MLKDHALPRPIHIFATIGLLAMSSAPALAQPAANAIVAPSPLPDAAPPFNAIRAQDYQPAIEEGIRDMQAEIDRIAANPAAPTFANTLVPLEEAGALLTRATNMFFSIVSADGTDEIQQIETTVQPELTAFYSALYTNQKLFARVKALWDARATLALAPEDARLLEVYHTAFVRSGAALPESGRRRLTEIDVKLAELSTRFSQNLVKDQKASSVLLTREEVAGMPESFQKSAKEKARAAGKDGYLVAATRSEFEPFLTLASNRSAREKVFRAFDNRGDNANDANNSAIIREETQLRLERAKLLGYDTYADYVLADSMAKTPAAALALLEKVYAAGLKRAHTEEQEFLQFAAKDGITRLQPWDWRYYAEKARRERFALDETRLKEYLPLDSMVDGLFDTTNRLFGLTFTERPDLPGWMPDVRVFEVRDRDGREIGLLYADWFTRDTKQPGAWMGDLRAQNGLTGARPIVTNNANFIRPADGGRALLSFDDTRTLFHEFGHALHGLLSQTHYPTLAGTDVYRDYVEFPSQIYEHWASEPEVLEKWAKNAKGEPMPKDLLDAFLAAQTFNQGYLTVQQLASALVDMKLHLLTAVPDDFDANAFERKVLADYKVPAAVGMRHRLAHFSHLFAGGYSAAYYAYTWAEVLDADGFDAFKEAGSVFDPATAARYRHEILETGNSRDPADSYRAFRGRDPQPDALLRYRGLMD